MKDKYLKNKEIMKFAKKLAYEQREMWECGEDCLYFDCKGQHIIDPFADSSMRYEFSPEEAYAYYGSANMDYFVEGICIKKVSDIFNHNYLERYFTDQGHFKAFLPMDTKDNTVVFEFYDSYNQSNTAEYKLYVHLSEDGRELVIKNERMEDITTYYEKANWSLEDVEYIRHGHASLMKSSPAQKQYLKMRLEDLEKSFSSVEAAIDDMNDANEFICPIDADGNTLYPFPESFDEFCNSIKKWISGCVKCLNEKQN